jgi:hypothetical protein
MGAAHSPGARRGLARTAHHDERGTASMHIVEAMDWADDNDTDYIFGLAGNTALDALVAATAGNLRFCHAMSSEAKSAHS